MVDAAPRLPPRLVAALERLDDGTLPIAEVCRRVGALAEGYGLTRPSYERVRVLVHAARATRRPLGPSDLELLLDASFRSRSPKDVAIELMRPRDERRLRK